MIFRPLGNTGINVSQICLGTMTWGEQNTQDQAFDQMDYALDSGINFFDTAEMYPVPPMAETYSATETIIGNWLASRKNRDKVIIASKVAAQADWLPYIRDGNICLDKKNITQALNKSLERLQTDYIDLYQLHWPDRSTNFFGELGYRHSSQSGSSDADTPIKETLEILGDLVAQGKIRAVGLSNETPWGAMKFLQLSESLGLPRMVSIQNPYNLLNRSFEVGLAEIAMREKCGLLAYSPLAFGVLSGKYLNNKKPASGRITLYERFSRYSNAQGTLATEAYVNIANKFQLDPSQMALAFVNTREFLTSNIIGATNMTQLKTNIESADLILSEEVIAEIENIHIQFSNPCP
ncbi:MAG: NADP(H)-dependent aldo-keto reductase [Gammaproteobacteria bacterium]|nr:NADP(H)-dependent aldo-keto reductase [Gammaproteobacteria bacterium]